MRWGLVAAGLFALVALLLETGCEDDNCLHTLTCPSTSNGSGGGTSQGGGATAGSGAATMLPNGAACDSASQCASGSCVDAVCCESSCDGACEGCNAAGSEGTCTPHLEGEDGDDECGLAACDGSGACLYGGHIWSKSFGSSDSEHVIALAVDGSGHVVIYGTLPVGPSTNFGGSPICCGTYLAKFDGAGNHLWSKVFPTNDAEAMAVAANGQIVIGGRFTNTINFGGSDLVAGSNHNFFVARFSPTGDHVYSKMFTVGALGSQMGALVIDDAGAVYGTGWFTTSVNFGASTLTGGSHDAFVFKLGPFGQHAWSKVFGGGSDSQHGEALALLPTRGDVVLAGSYSSTTPFDLGGGPLPTTNATFLAVLNTDGNHVWSKGLEGPCAKQLAATPSDHIVTAGIFSGTIDLGTGDLVAQGSGNICVAQFDADGVNQWSKGIPGEQITLSDIAVDAENEIVLVGGTFGSMDFGGATLPPSPDDSNEAFIAKLDSSGAHRWSAMFTGTWAQQIHAAGIWPDGTIAIAGEFLTTLDLGGGALPWAGLQDIFLAKLGP